MRQVFPGGCVADRLRPGDFAGRADFGGSGGDFAGAGLYRCRAAALQKIGGCPGEDCGGKVAEGAARDTEADFRRERVKQGRQIAAPAQACGEICSAGS